MVTWEIIFSTTVVAAKMNDLTVKSVIPKQWADIVYTTNVLICRPLFKTPVPLKWTAHCSAGLSYPCLCQNISQLVKSQAGQKAHNTHKLLMKN